MKKILLASLLFISLSSLAQSSRYRVKNITKFGWAQQTVPVKLYSDSTWNAILFKEDLPNFANGFWGLQGNTLNNNTSFIGTTDNRSMRFRANNIEFLKADSIQNMYGRGSLIVGTGPSTNTLNINLGSVKLLGNSVIGARTYDPTSYANFYLQADNPVKYSANYFLGSAYPETGIYKNNSFVFETTSKQMTFLNYESAVGEGSIVFANLTTSAIGERLRIATNGNIGLAGASGVKTFTPQAFLDISPSTTSFPQINLQVGVAPTTPTNGNVYYTSLKGFNLFGGGLSVKTGTPNYQQFQVSNWVQDPTMSAIYLNKGTPTATNYFVGGDSLDYYVNSPRQGVFRTNNVNRLLLNGQSVPANTGAYFIANTITNTAVGANIPTFRIAQDIRQWNTGAIPLIYTGYLSGNAYSAVGSSTATDVFAWYVEKAIAGSNLSITNNYGFGTNGMSRLIGNVMIGSSTTPVALLQVAAGNSTTSAIMLTSQADYTTGISGSMWYNSSTGFNLFGVGSHIGPASRNNQTTVSQNRISNSTTSILDIGNNGVAGALYGWANRNGSKTATNYNFFMDEYDNIFNDSSSFQLRFNNVSCLNVTNLVTNPSASAFFRLTPNNSQRSTLVETRGFHVLSSTQGFLLGGVLAIQNRNIIDATTYTAAVSSTLSVVNAFKVSKGVAGTGVVITNNNAIFTDGNISLGTVGDGISIKEGTNASVGRSTLVGGTVVVSNTRVTANSEIFVTGQGGSIVNLGSYSISARTAGVSFTILSSNILDVNTVSWFIVEPN